MWSNYKIGLVHLGIYVDLMQKLALTSLQFQAQCLFLSSVQILHMSFQIHHKSYDLKTLLPALASILFRNLSVNIYWMNECMLVTFSLTEYQYCPIWLLLCIVSVLNSPKDYKLPDGKGHVFIHTYIYI